jgi:hypothetical protein
VLLTLQEYFEIWTKQDEAVVYRTKNGYLAVKRARRGNDIYQFILRSKLRMLSYYLQGRNALLITLTSPSIQQREAWEEISMHFKKLLVSIKRHYQVEYIRYLEASEEGMPVIKALIFFDKHLSIAVLRTDVRVERVKDLDKAIMRIASLDTRSLSYLWIFRKPAFTVSRRLNRILHSVKTEPPGTFVGIYPMNAILPVKKPRQKEGSWVHELIDMPRAIYSDKKERGV